MRNWVWAQQCGKRGLNTTPVAVGPGFETTRRAKLVARTASGRAAAHGRTKQPGPTSQALRRPEHPWDHKQHLHSQLHSNTPKSHMRNMRAS